MAQPIRLIAFDLDGTLTQHKSSLGTQNRSVLEQLQQKYRLLMVGAGTCPRIYRQMGEFPIDIIGNYGMQYAEYDSHAGELIIRRNESAPVDRNENLHRAEILREKYALHAFVGETMEFHPTGMITFPILGTKAAIEDKLAYDPDRKKRRQMYDFARELFHDYTVFIGGSSSFDIVPHPYCKLYALDRYLKEHNIRHDETLYCGDDYHDGGNDHDVFASDIDFLKVDDYTNLEELLMEKGVL